MEIKMRRLVAGALAVLLLATAFPVPSFAEQRNGADLSENMLQGVGIEESYIVNMSPGILGGDVSDKSNPQEIQVNKKITNTFTYSQKYHYYTFSISKPGYITATVEHEVFNSSYSFNLYNSHGFSQANNICSASIDCREALPAEVGLAGIPAGEYYVELYASDAGIEKPYGLTINYNESDSWEREKDSASDPTAITLNKTVYGTLQIQFDGKGSSRDTDYFTFTLDKPGYISVKVEHEIFDNEYIYYLYNSLGYSSDSNLIDFFSVDGNDHQPMEAGLVGLPAGKYYIKLNESDPGSKHNYVGKKYGLTVNYTESDCWEQERDSASNPTNVVLGKKIYGAIQSNVVKDTNDYYKFALEQATSLTMVFGHETTSNYSSYNSWSYYLYGANGFNGTELSKGYIYYDNKETSNIKLGKLEAGTYYIKIGGSNVTYKKYWFSLGKKDDSGKEDDPGSKTVSISKATIKLDKKSYEWSDTGVFPVFTVTYKGQGVPAGEYSVTYLDDSNYRTGTATAVITGLGVDKNKDSLFFNGTKKVKFKIVPYDFNSGFSKGEISVVTDKKEYPYQLGGVKPEPTVKYKDRTLVKGVDYTVGWKNNKVVANSTVKNTPSIILKGKGCFKGKTFCSFSIVRQSLSAKNGFSIAIKDKKWSKKENSYKSQPVVKDGNGKTLKAGRDYEKLTLDNYTYEGKQNNVQPKAGDIITVTVVGKGNFEGSMTGKYILTN